MAALERDFLDDGLLLFVYGGGNGLPVALVGTAAGGISEGLDCSRLGYRVDPIDGGVLIALGFHLRWRGCMRPARRLGKILGSRARGGPK
ncbi:MAG TPA: hypothetical protein VGS20_11725 [Candidatus Acidoferrales bacterium]|nr:hypothetical protein [Candidatus Acidoferrales bacterium]